MVEMKANIVVCYDRNATAATRTAVQVGWRIWKCKHQAERERSDSVR